MKHSQHQKPFGPPHSRPGQTEPRDSAEARHLNGDTANDSFISPQDIERVIFLNVKSERQAQAYKPETPLLGQFIDLAV